MVRMQGGLSEYPVIRAINIVELNVSETKLDDSHLASFYYVKHILFRNFECLRMWKLDQYGY